MDIVRNDDVLCTGDFDGNALNQLLTGLEATISVSIQCTGLDWPSQAAEIAASFGRAASTATLLAPETVPLPDGGYVVQNTTAVVMTLPGEVPPAVVVETPVAA